MLAAAALCGCSATIGDRGVYWTVTLEGQFGAEP